MSALGYTYAFAEGVESEDGASSLELESSDEPRLLTWAAEDTDVGHAGLARSGDPGLAGGSGSTTGWSSRQAPKGTYRLREAPPRSRSTS